MFKGDTININHGGRDYQINIVDCKPKDQICVIEADINVDFDAPLDYVEPAEKQIMSGLGKNQTAAAKKQEEEAMKKKREDIRRMYKRLDGK